MILPVAALDQHLRHWLPSVANDFAPLRADIARIGADFARSYPRPVCSRAGGVGFSGCGRGAAALRRVQDLVISAIEPLINNLGINFDKNYISRAITGYNT